MERQTEQPLFAPRHDLRANVEEDGGRRVAWAGRQVAWLEDLDVWWWLENPDDSGELYNEQSVGAVSSVGDEGGDSKGRSLSGRAGYGCKRVG